MDDVVEGCSGVGEAVLEVNKVVGEEGCRKILVVWGCWFGEKSGKRCADCWPETVIDVSRIFGPCFWN